MSWFPNYMLIFCKMVLHKTFLCCRNKRVTFTKSVIYRSINYNTDVRNLAEMCCNPLQVAHLLYYNDSKRIRRRINPYFCWKSSPNVANFKMLLIPVYWRLWHADYLLTFYSKDTGFDSRRWLYWMRNFMDFICFTT